MLEAKKYWDVVCNSKPYPSISGPEYVVTFVARALDLLNYAADER